MIHIEVYDEKACCQSADGTWPTKTICVSKAWLDEYARSETKYRSADELLAEYTFDEIDGIESRARQDGALMKVRRKIRDKISLVPTKERGRRLNR